MGIGQRSLHESVLHVARDCYFTLILSQRSHSSNGYEHEKNISPSTY